MNSPDLTNPSELQALLRAHGIAPRRSAGQHFLVDEEVVKRFVEATYTGKDDVVVEIGPGVGTFTRALARRVKHVCAFEKDARLIPVLKETMQEFQNVHIIREDARHIDTLTIPFSRYHLAGSLPYYAASFLIRHFLESLHPPYAATFIVQHEVAERITARTPRANLLGTAVQFFGTPEYVMKIPPSSFWPPPKVHSAIVHIHDIQRYLKAQSEFTRAFFRVLAAGFSSPRKQLVGVLSKKLSVPVQFINALFSSLALNARARPQELSIAQWKELTTALRPHLPVKRT